MRGSFAPTRWLAACALLLTTLIAHASVGYREMVIPGTTMGVWYPSDAPEQARKVGPFEIDYAFDAAPRQGSWPLIVFSHGTGGHYRNHYLTLQALAKAGFVVAAPQHTSDKAVRIRQFKAAFQSRTQDIAHAVAAIQADPALGAATDTSVVHGLGYAFGAASVLAAAGAPVDEALIKSHCQQHASEDLDFCSDTPMLGLQRRYQQLRAMFSGESVADPSLPSPINGAIALVAPVGQGLQLSASSLHATRILDIAIDGDVIVPPHFHAMHIAQALPEITRLVHEHAHHYAFIAPIPKWALGKNDYFIINDPAGFDRLAFLRQVNAELVQFFSNP